VNDIVDPEKGDVVAWFNSKDEIIIGRFGFELTQGDAVVIMHNKTLQEKMALRRRLIVDVSE